MGTWQMGLATAAGAMMLANPVHAANAMGSAPASEGSAMVALLVVGFFAISAVARRRREARVIC